MPIKASIHLPNLQQWLLHPMLVLHRSNLGLLIVQPQIMLLQVWINSAFPSLTMIKTISLLAMHKRVPSISSNLASLNKICHDNKCWYYFNENILSIQALTKGKVLCQGKSEDGVYPSILIKLLNLLCPLNSITMLLSPLFSIKHFGIWRLVILMIKFSNFFFLISSLYWISILIWIILVHIVCMVKCIIFIFQNLSLLHLLLLNLYTLMCGVLYLCNQ